MRGWVVTSATGSEFRRRVGVVKGRRKGMVGDECRRRESATLASALSALDPLDAPRLSSSQTSTRCETSSTVSNWKVEKLGGCGRVSNSGAYSR